MSKTKNIILYSLVMIMVVAILFYFKFVFLNNNFLEDGNFDNNKTGKESSEMEEALVPEPTTTETQENVLTEEIQEEGEALIEKEVNGITYKMSLKMQSEDEGKKVILYDIVTPDIKEEKLRILTKKIVQDIINEEKVEKIVLFFHKDESLLGVKFSAKAIWDFGKISIEIAQEI